jgi:hypothetical protein
MNTHTDTDTDTKKSTGTPSSRALSDAALVLLSPAASRVDGLVLPPPAPLRTRGGALKATLRKLLAWEFIEEVQVTSDNKSWRTDEEHGRVGLRITAAGLNAIGVTVPVPAQVAAEVSEQVQVVPTRSTLSKLSDAPRRSAPKRTQLIDLLRPDPGASIGELAIALEWLPHTTRAALTGLRQRGMTIVKAKRDDGTTVYRIAGEATDGAANSTSIHGAPALLTSPR